MEEAFHWARHRCLLSLEILSLEVLGLIDQPVQQEVLGKARPGNS